MARARPQQAALEAWLDAQGWSLAPFQADLVQAFAEGADGLCLAGTGSGKTLGAFLAPALSAPAKSTGLQVLWLTPLRALARDLATQLESFCEALALPWRVGIRNGDSTAKERRQLRQALPEVLVTTPESREGYHLFLYPFAGRQVHEGLGPLLAWRLGQHQESTVAVTVNDYGIELLSSAPLPEEERALRRWLSPEGLGEALLACCEGTGLAE